VIAIAAMRGGGTHPVARRRQAAFVLAAVCGAIACSSGGGAQPGNGGGAPRAAVEPVVARDAVLFDRGAIPDAMAASLASARVVLLGETHYVQEHQELLVALIPRLHAAGFRLLLQEQMHATAWAGEEYAQLRSDALPVEVAAFDRTLLDGLRAFNATQPEADRLHFVGFDMNHWTGIFPAYLRLFQERFGNVPQLDGLLAAQPDSAAYAAALRDLPSSLAAGAAALTAAIGADRFAQLLDLVDVEARSLALRGSSDFAPREVLIRERIVKTLASSGGARVAVNCGAAHAQKASGMGPLAEPVGAWLASHPEAYGGDSSRLRSVAFLGARGELKDHFYDVTTRRFDVIAEAPENDLVRILAERAGAREAWLPFSDPLFSSEDVEFDAAGALVVARPVALFDALVLYPVVTVLESLALLP
jgi:hypothetical protein